MAVPDFQTLMLPVLAATIRKIDENYFVE
jgi:hypothetical protein